MSWNQEREDLLRKLWLQGLSASQIAYVMSGITRNAVIGKAHRMGLPKRSPATSQRPKVRVQRGKPSLACVGGRPSARPDVREAPVRDEFAFALAKANFEAVQGPRDASERVPLMTLTSRTCKWPIGDPADPDFHFCSVDAESGRSYCEFHHRLAYRGQRRRAETVETAPARQARIEAIAV